MSRHAPLDFCSRPHPSRRATAENHRRVCRPRRQPDGCGQHRADDQPAGWSEPRQTPQFDEYTVVLRGCLVVESSAGSIEVRAGQAIVAQRGQWVRYSTPHEGGAEYIAVCLPAFSPETVNREKEA